MEEPSVWTDLKASIQRHYDLAAPLYKDLWGIHIHHGYWRHGSESKELAQEQLVDILADSAEIAPGSRILDIGCGFGGSARHLARRFGAHVVGISISPGQIETGVRITRDCIPPPQFVVMDAEHMGFAATFDVIWSIEAVSHLAEKERCFRAARELLATNGRFAIVDWFKAEGLDREQERRYIDPIVHHMLLPRLDTARAYVETLERLGYRVRTLADISSHVSRTWDICVEIGRMPAVWKFAVRNGHEFISFLRGFAAMKRGFASRAFQCAMLVAEVQR